MPDSGPETDYRERLQAESERWANLAAERHEPTSWLRSPLVQRHIRRQVTGDPQLFWGEVVLQHFFPPQRRGGRGLSLGCNEAPLERMIVQSGYCAAFDGFDISAQAIANGRRAAAAAGVDLNLQVADINTLELPPDTYDLALITMALHHVEQLEAVCGRIHAALRQDGIFVFDEFVGPTRFQWTEAQLQAANAMRHRLPAALRRLPSGEPAGPVTRPELEAMRRFDPFEAIRSAEILDVVRRQFRVLAQRDYGGTVLHLALQPILVNFDETDAAHRELLQQMCDEEQRLIAAGALPSDFTVVVAARRDSTLPALA